MDHEQSSQNWQATLRADTAAMLSDPKAALTITQNSDTFCNLSELGLLELSGADAVSFLQGQVSNDVTLLKGNNAHYSAYCTPKGRMLALFLAFAHNNPTLGHHVHLQMDRALTAGVMKRLSMYVLRSKVKIQDLSDTIIKIGINGPNAAALLKSIFGELADVNFESMQNYALLSLENGTILKLPTIAGHNRFEIFTSHANANTIWNALKTDCQLVGKPCWDWLDIQSGIPDIYPATQEQFVPQMLNLDLINGISFKKGCYTGQEIVARTHYLGTVKRRTYLAEIQSEQSPQAGDKMLDDNKNEVGQIVRVSPNLNNGFDALIEMRIESAQNAFWQDHAIKIKDLPYSLGDAGS